MFYQIFEVNEEYYFSSEEEKEQQEEELEDVKTTTTSKDFSTAATDSVDTDKEPCIDGKIESSSSFLSAVSDDSYTSNFHFVKKFDQNGNLVDSWGTVGPKDGQFLQAHGITIDSKDNVYVSDAEKCNIQKFDKDGNFINKWGTKRVGPGEFLQPESMAIDSSDKIYLAEYSRKNIQKFDSDGNSITMWGSIGCKDDQFLILHDIAMDSKAISMLQIAENHTSEQIMIVIKKIKIVNNDNHYLKIELT